MKRKLLLTLVTAGVATAVWATRRHNATPWSARLRDIERPRRGNPMASSQAADADEAFDASSDALGLLVTLDEQMIALAEQALTRSRDAAVRGQADALLAAHSEALAATQAFDVDVMATREVTALREQHERHLPSLATRDDAAFDRNLVDALVRTHQQALDLLDTLLPDVLDEEVREYVAGARARIAQHLQAERSLREDQLV